MSTIPNNQTPVIGNCGKHPGHNFVNCPLCAIEEQQKLADKIFGKKYHAVEYAGYWRIQEGAFYGDKDILNAEEVGEEQAAKNAKRIEDLLNQLATDGREEKTDFQIAWELSQTKDKPFFVNAVKKLLNAYDGEEISFSKFVEELNVAAWKWHGSKTVPQ